jgi:hypothetical protein
VSKWFGLTIVGGIALRLSFIGYAMMRKLTTHAAAPMLRNYGTAPHGFAKYRQAPEAPSALIHVAAAPYHPGSSPPQQIVQSLTSKSIKLSLLS